MLDSPPAIIAVLSDLIFTVKIMDAAKRFGAKASFLKDQATALLRVHDRPGLVIFDLNYDAANPLAIITRMKAEPDLREIPTVGYVSHVQVELRVRAEASGCDLVVPRSVFVQKLPEILGRYLAKTA